MWKIDLRIPGKGLQSVGVGGLGGFALIMRPCSSMCILFLVLLCCRPCGTSAEIATIAATLSRTTVAIMIAVIML